MDVNLRDATTPCPGCGRQIPLSAAACPLCGAAADTTSTFLSMRYPAGGGGAIDQQTAAFFRSDLPDPVPADVDDLLGRTTLVRVSELVFRDNAGRFEPLFEVARPAGLAAFRTALRVRPENYGHAMTIETHRVECLRGSESLATLELVVAYVLRWPGRWRSDGLVADPGAVGEVFAAHGCPALRAKLEWDRADEARRQAEYETWLRTWEATVPPDLAPLVDDLSHEHYAAESPARDRALAVLADAYPSVSTRILALFAWFGHGTGPWNPCRSVELAPFCVLQAFPHETIIAALRRPDLTTQQLEGAARFLCQWVHPRWRPQHPPEIPADVRDRLWQHVLASGNEDKIRSAATTFGGPPSV